MPHLSSPMPTPITAKPAPPAERPAWRRDIELLRILSGFAIVAFHAQVPNFRVAGTGTVIFLLSSIYLGGQHGRPMDVALQRRSRALLLPWAFWFVLYGLLNLYRGMPWLDDSQGWIAGVLAGTSIHLWFLPFTFLALSASDLLRRAVPPPWLVGMAAVGMLLSLNALPGWRAELPYSPPISQYLFALPACCMGLLLLLERQLPRPAVWAVLGLAALSLLCGITDTGVQRAYLGCLAFLAVMLDGRLNRWLPWDPSKVSQHMFGVYVLHPFWLLVGLKLGMERGWLLPVFAFAAAWLSTALAKRLWPRATRWVI